MQNMVANIDYTSAMDFELPHTDAAELKSNQSVRATFRLSENTILAMNIISNQLGVKQKSLFDHLIADTDALEIIARRLKKKKQRNKSKTQKTFIISRKTLSILQKMEDDHKASRDALVEFSIQRLKPVIEQEKGKQESRKRIALEVQANLEAQKQLLHEANLQLGEQDPVCEQLSHAVNRLNSAYRSIDTLVKKGEKIAEFNM
ncbi:MAG: hypothetical protein PVI54_11140 [Desulfobacteraceae bacterium]|jgi:hypothetical protein